MGTIGAEDPARDDLHFNAMKRVFDLETPGYDD